ncbi:MAG: hypothetical protein Q9212_007000, partial [Teloschistes hypoglaucus]
MRYLNISSVLLTLTALVSAIPATNHIPTAIIQTAQGTSNDSVDSTNSGVSKPKAFDRRFPVPNTDTVLHIAPGTPVDHGAFGVLFPRLQVHLNVDIAIHRRDGIPGNSRAPSYRYFTTTPGGIVCYFFVSAYTGQRFTYGMVDDILAGLKIFLIDQKRYEQVVFEVENHAHLKAFGGLSIGPVAESMRALTNDTSSTVTPADLLALQKLTLDLSCTFGDPLPLSAIIQALGIATIAAMSHITKGQGEDLLPGPARGGEFEVHGILGANFRIFGVEPVHLTWEMMQAATQRLRSTLAMPGKAVEAHCTVMFPGHRDVIGVVMVTKDGGGVA